jgi:hypothetical protein
MRGLNPGLVRDKGVHPVMKKLIAIAAAALCFASAASAQPFPANGYIGLYADMAGTQCCISAPAGMPVTFHFVATLAGLTTGGISGAEFRMETSSDISGAGFFQAFSPAAGALVIGSSPFDFNQTDPTPPASEGINIAFPECQMGTGGRVYLGSMSAFITGAITNVEVQTLRRNPPTNVVEGDCPLVTLCDAPTFTKVCLTIPTGAHGESINFKSGINLATCNTACTPVAVSDNTWSGVKDLYR